ncbi:2,3-dihydro-2,3-dihydroxybenzoate dehydrogenase [Micromonospora sp. NPDC005215]|uniref:2,3-dihydro-2,3-dihydroxybenzoate dehydrogenase n=1 Tax=Micromonospora sp. NPDC005215 TaxID=3157024 RepID=UPI0033BA69D9
MSVMSSDDRVVLVTGAAQGIGAAVARMMAADGALVAAVDVDAGGLAATVAALPGAAQAYPADVRDSAAVEALVKQVEEDLGPVRVLVNVAGVLRTGPVTELSDQDWNAVFAVNTDGVFHCCRAVARRMVRRRSGTIVTVSSNVTGVPRTSMAAYAASKAASSLFTKCLGLELAEFGIRCNVVSPGSTDTPMQRAFWTGASGPEFSIRGSLEAYRVGIPLGRIGTPEDVAAAVRFLASPEAGHITMQELFVDGGAALVA